MNSFINQQRPSPIKGINYHPVAQLVNTTKQQEYASFLKQQIQQKEINRREMIQNKSRLNTSFLQEPPKLSRSRFQFFQNDEERRLKAQQQMLEQDIMNYNRMMAQSKQKQKRYRSVDSQTTFTKFPRIHHSEEKTQEIQQIQEISRTKSRQSRMSRNNAVDNSFIEIIDENQYTNQLKQQIDELKLSMKNHQQQTKLQISQLIDFVKYNESQATQYLKMQEDIKPILENKSVQPLYNFLRKEKEIRQQYYHPQEVAQIVNYELQSDTKFILAQEYDKLENSSIFDYDLL